MSEASDIASLTFEQALAELEQIVARLESGQAPLDQSLDLYERGARLKAHCGARRRARRRGRRVQLMNIFAQRLTEAADLVTVALDELLPRADGPESRLTE